MIRHKAYRFRLYPTKEQMVKFNKTIGSARFVYNLLLSEWNNAYERTGRGLTYNSCSARLPDLKREHEWLKEPDSVALQSSLRDLADAFHRFFTKQNNRPRFKKKNHSGMSYTTKQTNGNIAVVGERLKLPKVGLVRFAKSREVEGRIISATIRRNPTGKYFVSLLSEVDIETYAPTQDAVGIDLGLKDFAILSTGEVFANPRWLHRLDHRLKQAQRVLSRRKHGGANWEKQRKKVARLHERIHDAREDFLHKLSTEIVKNHDVIGIEDLQVERMLKDRRYAKGISEVSWARFRVLLTYKASWYGRTLVAVDKSFPSSQLCSSCGNRHREVKNLNLREWICPSCGDYHNRDHNAALNILNEAKRICAVGTTV